MKRIAKRLLEAACVLIAALGATAYAQDWPMKPVRFVVPVPPGTAPDITARLIGDRLSKAWGKQAIVEDRPGASGAIAMRVVADAKADGYTFVFAPAFVYTLTPHLLKNPGFDLDREFVPVAGIAGTPMLIAANPQLKANTLPEVLKLAKAQPGKINFANPQYASVPYLVVEMLNQAAGVNLYNVAFSGTVPAITAAINGDAQLVVDGTSPLVPHVKSGKLKIIAVTAAKKLPGLESYPLANETLRDFVVMGWFGIVAPKGVPESAIQRVNVEVNKALEIPELVDRLREIGTYPMPGTVQDFAKFLGEERRRWAGIIKAANIQPQ